MRKLKFPRRDEASLHRALTLCLSPVLLDRGGLGEALSGFALAAGADVFAGGVHFGDLTGHPVIMEEF